MEWLAMVLDDLIPQDHEARSVWAFVETWNLTPLYARIAAVEGRPGRDTIGPKILMALWLYATIDGVGSARKLDLLCQHHHAYRWLCGGVSVNYHTLADFRTAHVEMLDQLLTESVASLLSAGLIALNRVAQDGMRVRAGAGSSSFRRRPKLEECYAAAKSQVEALRAEAEEALTTSDHGSTVYAPVKDEEKKRRKGEDPYAPRPGDSAAVAAWRRRMGTAEAKEIYKDRAATAECVNAIARNRNLRFIRVHGVMKARAIALWYVLAHNLRRALALRAESPAMSSAARG
jgi:transposase